MSDLLDSANAPSASQTSSIETDSCLGILESLLLDNTKVGYDLASMVKAREKDLALLKQWQDRYNAILQAGTVARSMASVAEDLTKEGDFELYNPENGGNSLSDIDELDMTDISQVRKRKPLSQSISPDNTDAYNNQDDLPASVQVKSPSSKHPDATKSRPKAILHGQATPRSKFQQKKLG